VVELVAPLAGGVSFVFLQAVRLSASIAATIKVLVMLVLPREKRPNGAFLNMRKICAEKLGANLK
jgi:hypothetical protein